MSTYGTKYKDPPYIDDMAMNSRLAHHHIKLATCGSYMSMVEKIRKLKPHGVH
jgi:hypothetical protein